MIDKPGWRNKPFWIRLLHWEYWSFHTIYLPLYPVFVGFCLRARSFFFFSAANPTIQNGGYLGESKKDLYHLLPAQLQPVTLFFKMGSEPSTVLEEITRAGMAFPVIGKPDIGGRGRGVKKLNDPSEVVQYILESGMDFHIQEFVDYPREAGIFYYRFPDQREGKISGIVEKSFLTVRGDGKKTVRELLGKNSRGILQLPVLEKTDPQILDRVIPSGEDFIVSPYGNHARGALFLDQSETVNSSLVQQMDKICSQIPLFYYGRLDIRYQNRELLEQGKSFVIIEVNGAGSEPTHIYDPRHSLFFAWREIVRHWQILYKISCANHRLGYRYLSMREGIAMYKKNISDSRILEKMQ